MVVFGIIDALTINQFRYPVVTSTAGADTFKAEWLDEFRCPVYVLPDKGEERTAKELVSEMVWRGHVVQLEYPPDCKDVNDYLIHGKESQLKSELSKIGAS